MLLFIVCVCSCRFPLLNDDLKQVKKLNAGCNGGSMCKWHFVVHIKVTWDDLRLHSRQPLSALVLINQLHMSRPWGIKTDTHILPLDKNIHCKNIDSLRGTKVNPKNFILIEKVNLTMLVPFFIFSTWNSFFNVCWLKACCSFYSCNIRKYLHILMS